MVPSKRKLSKKYHLNGHTIEFHHLTQKAEQHYVSPQLLTLGMKGLRNMIIGNLYMQIVKYIRKSSCPQ